METASAVPLMRLNCAAVLQPGVATSLISAYGRGLLFVNFMHTRG